jgi:ADP-dependent NAD(P)H-hydrate dehydratase / NAD(P)H-hydrate epimerase
MSLPVISVEQMREWERATWVSGRTQDEVIRRVGACIGRRALELTRPGERVVILAGKGHNGEDARCAREHLAARRVDVLEVGDPAAEVSKLEALLSMPTALVIDGLFGIGLDRPLSPEWAALIERLNGKRARVLAVDVPSGLDADTGQSRGAAVRAAFTLTVGAPKIGLLESHAWPFVGRLEVASDVGLVPCPVTSDVKWVVPEDFKDFPPLREVATHKGSYGHLAILAGSLGFHGAAVMSAKGAQRAQPGLITLYTLESVYYVVAPQLQSVMVSPWRPSAKLTALYDAVLIGPGLAATDVPDQLKMFTRHLWRDSETPVVVDASALDWVPLEAPRRNAVRVITPHPGEAARMVRGTSEQVQTNRVAALRNISQRFGNSWVVLKGHQTLVGCSTGDVLVNSSGNPHLAQGGSGDVLSGYAAGLLAQPALQEDPLRTLACAVWQHGAAADRLQSTRAAWVIEDLIAELGRRQPGEPPFETTDSGR